MRLMKRLKPTEYIIVICKIQNDHENFLYGIKEMLETHWKECVAIKI